MLKRKGIIFSLAISAVYFVVFTILNIAFGFSWNRETSTIFFAIAIYFLSTAAYRFGVIVSAEYSFEEGYEMGKEHGKIIGRMDGYAEGYAEGIREGYDLGVNGFPESYKPDDGDDNPNIIHVDAEVE